MIRRPPRSTHCISSAASDVYKRQHSLPPQTQKEFVFQATSSKVIYTSYLNKLKLQYVSIYCSNQFPALSAEDLKELERAPAELHELKEGSHLSIDTINKYIDLLKKKSGSTILSCVNCLLHGDRSTFAEERKLNMNAQQIFFPIKTDHWILLKINTRAGVIGIYDSSPCGVFTDAAIQFLNSALPSKKEWKYVQEECPKHRHECDSGVFLCTSLELLTRGKQPWYSTEDIPYLRKKIAIELLNGKIL
eukprot:TRINITY_DN13405_c0_g4_i1.p1 TRINITY_DN13405_c0_g4~~TRINITY_DN13405_c0_g4_i1.p1  ORF type:complete len:255 (+),score=28.24 TRINITY_DN13405_c0_g4_i1:23-766(+)